MRAKSIGTLIFVVIMLILASASNAAMDTLQSRFGGSVFAKEPRYRQWLDPSVSWHNKWKHGDPKLGEAFPFSSTAFVAATDGWHFFKALTIFCLLVALIAPLRQLYQWSLGTCVLVYVGLDLLRGIVFEVFYRWLW
jgi:hypothetical protein